jgi:hypothetical protein
MRQITSRTVGVTIALLSIGVSILLALYLNTVVLFLLIPLFPFLFRGKIDKETRKCPSCGFTTSKESYDYCPCDGEELRAYQN